MRRLYQIAIILLAAAHIFLTPLLVRAAYFDRGRIAAGGEYLVLPLIAVAALVVLRAIESRRNRED